LELQGFGTRAERAVEDSALRGMQRGSHDALGDNVELGLFVDSGDCVYQFEVQRSVHVAVLWMVESRKAAPALAITAPNDMSARFSVRLGGQHVIPQIGDASVRIFN
jgi:hypothetical protein